MNKKAAPKSKPNRKTRKRVRGPRPPKDFDDPVQLEKYQGKLKRFLGEE